MRIAVYSTKPYDRRYLEDANQRHGHELTFLEPRLSSDTASLASGFNAVSIFVSDTADRTVIEQLARGGTRLIALRSAGFNHVDLDAAAESGVTVVRVPAYSPHAVAEFTVGMILALARKYHRAHNRVREGNFALEGLVGFDLHGRTVGIVGTGNIGFHVARILTGFGCEMVGYDPQPSERCRSLGLTYLSLEDVLARGDIITLHSPLTPQTRHLIDRDMLKLVRPGMMLINTSRGALVDTEAVIEALKDGRVGYLGLDVYEEEENLFFEDLSDRLIQDDIFSRLLTFPNVLITGHQAFLTEAALTEIAETTLTNVDAFAAGRQSGNEVEASPPVAG